MAEKERKKLKISKRILASFKRNKKLVKINEESILEQSKLEEGCDASYYEDVFNETSENCDAEVTFLEASVDLEDGEKASSTETGARPKTRTSSSSLEGVEGHVLTRPRQAVNFHDFELHSSFSVSTDSGIDCTANNADRLQSPERVLALVRRGDGEHQQVQESKNEQKRENGVIEVASSDSLDIAPSTNIVVREESELLSEINTTLLEKLNGSLKDNGNSTENQTVLKSTDSVSEEIKELDSSEQEILSCCIELDSHDDREDTELEETSGDCSSAKSHPKPLPHEKTIEHYFLNMYANKTDETKSAEARMERQNEMNNQSVMVVSPTPKKPVTSQAEQKALPSTPNPAEMYVNQKGAFARYRSLRRSMSDVGKGILGRFRHKKRHDDSMQDESWISNKSVHKSRRKKKSSKSSHLKKTALFSESDINLDCDKDDSVPELRESLSASMLQENTDDHKRRTVHYLPAYKHGIKDDLSSTASPVREESLTYEICSESMSPAANETIQDLTLSICEMTTSLIEDRCSSHGSIDCICDCKDCDSNSLCCEKRRSQDLDDFELNLEEASFSASNADTSQSEIHVDDVSLSPNAVVAEQGCDEDSQSNTSSSSLDSTDFYTDDTESCTESEYTDFESSVAEESNMSDKGLNHSVMHERDRHEQCCRESAVACKNGPCEIKTCQPAKMAKSFSVSFENLDLINASFNQQLPSDGFYVNKTDTFKRDCDRVYHLDSPVCDTPACSPNVVTHLPPRSKHFRERNMTERGRHENKNNVHNGSFFSDRTNNSHGHSQGRQQNSYFDANQRIPGDGCLDQDLSLSQHIPNRHSRQSNVSSRDRHLGLDMSTDRSSRQHNISLNSSHNGSFHERRLNKSSSGLNNSVNAAHNVSFQGRKTNHFDRSLNGSLNMSHNNSYYDDLNTSSYTPPLDLSTKRHPKTDGKSTVWMDRHVGQVLSPAKRVLHKNAGLSESDLCKQILNLYVSDAESSMYEAEFEKSFEEGPSMVDVSMADTTMEPTGGISADDSLLQYGTYVAPRVVKETNVDDFNTTSRPACYPGEARRRRLHASPTNSTTHLRGEDRRLAADEELKRSKKNRPRSVPSRREILSDSEGQRSSSNQHRSRKDKPRPSERSALKDRTNTQGQDRTNMEGRDRTSKDQSSKSVPPNDRGSADFLKVEVKEAPEGRKAGENKGAIPKRKKGKENLDASKVCEKTFDKLVSIYTYKNSERKVRCLSLNEAQAIDFKHYPPPKEASRVSWKENLCKLDSSHHTPRKTPVKTKPILLSKKQQLESPYVEETPSPIVLTKMRKSKSSSRKYKNWPW